MKKIIQLICGLVLTTSISSQAQVTLNATGGILTATYTNVNSAFGAINAGVHTGSINILITGNTVEGALNYIPTALVASGQATANYSGITIKPTLTATISGAPATGYGVLELDGADNVTFDGSITTNTKDLTIENANANTVLNTAAVRFIGRAVGGLGATFNTVKNCIIKGSTEGGDGISGSTVTSAYGLYMGSNTTISTSGTGDNYDNNTVTNNNFIKCFIGLYIFGNTNTADNNLINNNNFGSNTPGQTLTFGGINLSAVTTSTIQQNQIFNLKMYGTTSSNNYGIQVAGATSSSLSIVRNNITGIWQTSTGGWGAYGINITAGNTFTVVNNTISDIQTTNYSNTSTTWNAFGIRFTGGTNMRVHYNSVNIVGTYTYALNTTAASAPLCITSTAFTGSITNNIFSNTMSSNAATSTFVAAWMPSFASYAAVVMNNNAYMVSSGTSYYVGRAGTGTNVYSTVAAFQPTTQVGNATNNNASVPISNIGGAPFISTTNLNIPANTVTQIESGAVLIPALGTNIDFTSAVRPLAGINPNLNPDIGAYEFDGITPPSCSGMPSAGSISGSQTTCNGASVILTLTTTSSSSLGISYQWSSSTSAVGPFTNNIGTSLTQATGIQTTTLFYVATVSCAVSGSVASTSVYTVNFAPNPTVSIASTNSIVCLGSSANFTASGALNYTWSPASSLSPSVGAVVVATPSINTIYNVLGTSSVGCSGTSTVQLSVNQASVTISSISASPSTICSVGNSTLVVTAISPTIGAYCQPIFSTGSGSGDYIGGVTLGSITNTTGPLSTPFYTVYPQNGNTTTTLTAGQAYTITLQEGTYGSSEYLSAWIDYNQNGDLNNAGEKLGESLSPGAFPLFTTIAFTVPSTAFNGTARLRVKCVFVTQNLDACTGATFGETEDYLLTIVGGVTPTTTISWTPATFLNSTTNSVVIANTATSSTTYTTLVTNAWGCSATGSVALTVTSNPTLTLTGPSTICAGQPANLTANGATTYTWNTGATTSTIAPTPTTNATYSVTGANGTCTSTAVKSVTVNSLPSVSLTAAQTTACVNGSTIALTGSPVGGVFTGSNVASSVFTPGASAGTYVQTYAYTNTLTGCSNTASNSIVVTVCTGLNTKNADGIAIQIYPNPNSGMFTVELNNSLTKTIQVTDLTGRIVLENTTTANNFNVNISTLANGVYYVKVISNNSVNVLKVVKQ